MDEDKTKWNKIFALRPDTLLPPESFLVRNIESLKVGSVLDLACGDGRNATFLARNKFNVTGVDSSSEALLRLQKFSAEMGFKIQTREMDLDSPAGLKKLGTFDNILISHYKPNPEFWVLVPELLNSLGTVVICTFNTQQHQTEGFPEKYCLAPQELKTVRGLQTVKHETFVEDDRHFDAYIFRKS